MANLGIPRITFLQGLPPRRSATSRVRGGEWGTALATLPSMGIVNQLSQYGNRRLTRRLFRSAPWLGGALALFALGSAVRRKGLFGGTADTALDFIPFVGGAKNLAEAARGRDFIRDKRRTS